MKTHNRLTRWLDIDDLCGERPAPMPFGVSDPEYLDLDTDDDGGEWEPLTSRQAAAFWAGMIVASAFGVALAALMMRLAGLR